jgi:hypothetical protein
MTQQYFAQIDENNLVVDVKVVDYDFLKNNPDRYPGRWIETFLDSDKQYAGIGFYYNETTNDFEPPKPGPDYYFKNKRWIKIGQNSELE